MLQLLFIVRFDTIKNYSNGTIDRLKAHSMGKGFTGFIETYNLDNAETFSPVAKLNFELVITSMTTNLI